MAKKGIFKKLFGKQEGGSIVGNILRGVGDKFTGGAYSQIFKRPGGNTTKAAPVNTGIAGTANLVASQPSKTSLMDKIRQKWAYVVGGVAAIALAVWYFAKPKKGYRRR